VTVAVLGTPIDEIYPQAHRGLAEEIVKTGGCVMSELPPGAVQGRDYHAKTCFLRRNRLISGLADVVVIPEAAERSGSLNTAAHALEQGREIFAVPGDITRPMSRGCNRLICQGATPYTGVEDVLELLFPTPRRSPKRQVAEISGDTEEETAILRVLAAGVRDGEEILASVALQAAEFSQAMTMLEIKGRVRALGANKWAMK
jgi:DNA processing protein